MKVKFYLESKTSKTGDKAIWCYVREFDNTLTLNTGQRIKPELWDKKVQRANIRKTKDKILKGNLRSINQFINAFENKIFEVERTVRQKEFSAGFSKVAEEIKKQFDKREETLFTAYDEFLKIKKLNISDAALKKYERVKSLLLEYQKVTRNNVSFNNITPLFFNKFFLFLVTNKKYINNTAHKTIQFLKSFIIWANKNKFTDNKVYKSFKFKSEVNEIIRLTNDELFRLYNLQLDSKKLERVRDVFVFQCLTGVRYSDIQNISRDDIKGATWTPRTKKTHQIINIPLNSDALSILAKYKDNPQPLPVISNQKMNTYLKELCKKAGINSTVRLIRYRGNERIENKYEKYKLIGTHTARRTFISISLERGVKPEVIMKITGHKTYRMMQRYLDIADKHVKDEMEKAWGGPLSLVK